MNAFKAPLELSVHAHMGTSLPMTLRPVKILMNVTHQGFAASIATMKEDLLDATVMKVMC